MEKIVSLPLRTEMKSEKFLLKCFRNGLNDFVSVFIRGRSGISRLVSMEISQDGRIIMLRFSDGLAASDVERLEIASVPRVPL